jgi:hypothetical protein
MARVGPQRHRGKKYIYRDTKPNQSFKNMTNSIKYQVTTTTATNVQVTSTLENKEFEKYLLLYSKALSTLPKKLHIQNRQINIATWLVHV